MPRPRGSISRAVCVALALCVKTILVSARSDSYTALGVCSWSRHGSRFPLQVSLDTCPTPIDPDDKKKGVQWAPWSYPPYCIQAAKLTEDSPPFCLYTAASFRGNHGMSIVTTPDLAASLVDGLDDSGVLDKDKHHPSSYMAPKNRNDLAYDIEDLPGRGKGVIARKSIPRWGVVMVGWPAIVLPMEYQKYFSVHQRRALLSRAVKQLPKRQQDEVLSLARSTGGEFIEDILKTNIFGIELDGIQYMGLFPEGSRVNHNCRPNVFWRYSPRTMTQEVVAMRDILPGEEITHSYVALGRTSQERKYVLEGWGFNCSCWLCTAPPAEIKASDSRRERIYDIHASLADMFEGESEYVPNEDQIHALAQELFALVEEEQLWPQMVMFYEVVARAYMEVEEWDKARKYITLSEQRWITYGGEDHDNVDGVRNLWMELRERQSMR